MRRLGGLDTAFLYLETPTNHLHVAWAAVLDTRGKPDAASPARLCELIGRRLHLLPALRQRLADPRLGYTQPDWIEVDVDPADHCSVHHHDDLEAVAADVVARPLDRHRPLWELHVVDGLPAGRTGMILKLHHAVLDGPSGAELMVQLLDLEPEAGPTHRRSTPLAVDRQPSRTELDLVAWRRAGRGASRAAAELRNAVDVWSATRRWDLEHPDVARPGTFGAPRTPFNRPITTRREVRFTSTTLDALDKVRRDSGSTINDVVLAVVGGALRRYLRRHHALPAAPLLAMVPVSTRDHRSPAGGNRLSGLVTTLATDIDDARDRLGTITRVTNAVKRRHDDTGLGSLVGLADVVPPRTGLDLARLSRQFGLARWAPLACNVVVSNVPGPDVPFYCNGAMVTSAYPMGPITDWSAINVTVVSYRRQLTFGITACPDVVPDVDSLRDDVDEAIEELQRSHAG